MLFFPQAEIQPAHVQKTEIVAESRVHPQRLLVRVDRRFDTVKLDTLCAGQGVRELWNLPQIGWRAIATLGDTYKDFDAEFRALNGELDTMRGEVDAFLAAFEEPAPAQ